MRRVYMPHEGLTEHSPIASNIRIVKLDDGRCVVVTGIEAAAARAKGDVDLRELAAFIAHNEERTPDGSSTPTPTAPAWRNATGENRVVLGHLRTKGAECHVVPHEVPPVPPPMTLAEVDATAQSLGATVVCAPVREWTAWLHELLHRGEVRCTEPAYGFPALMSPGGVMLVLVGPAKELHFFADRDAAIAWIRDARNDAARGVRGRL